MTAAKSKLGAALRRAAVVMLLIFVPNLGWAQTSAPLPLSPAAQQALDKGIIAAKVPDYPLAIRFFEAAKLQIGHSNMSWRSAGQCSRPK